MTGNSSMADLMVPLLEENSNQEEVEFVNVPLRRANNHKARDRKNEDTNAKDRKDEDTNAKDRKDEDTNAKGLKEIDLRVNGSKEEDIKAKGSKEIDLRVNGSKEIDIKMPLKVYPRGSIDMSEYGSDAADRKRRYLDDSSRLYSSNDEHLSALADVSSVDTSPHIRRRMADLSSNNTVVNNDSAFVSSYGARRKNPVTTAMSFTNPSDARVKTGFDAVKTGTFQSDAVKMPSDGVRTMGTGKSDAVVRKMGPPVGARFSSLIDDDLQLNPWAQNVLKRSIDETVLLNTTDPESLLTSLVLCYPLKENK
jgi:hypothetical protein